MLERGAHESEVIDAIRLGDKAPAKRARVSFRKNFQYEAHWGGKYYAIKQILVIVAEKANRLVVVTVYSFYF